MATVNEIAQLLLPCALAAIGGLVGQLYMVVERDRPFTIAGCVAYITTAAFIGFCLNDIVREDFRGKRALLLVSGTMPYVFLAMLRRWAKRIFGQAAG